MTADGQGRSRQRLRTRKDLLLAAGRLLEQGQAPSMEEVAAEAQVSRATAYRYFSTVEALLVEAPLQGDAPDPEQLFATDRSADPEVRIRKALVALHRMTYRNESQLRLLVARTLAGDPGSDGGIPRRQNRRTLLIEAALEPVRAELAPAAYRKLCRALALLFGTEAMIVCTDVLQISKREARETTVWAARALVRAAIGREPAASER